MSRFFIIDHAARLITAKVNKNCKLAVKSKKYSIAAILCVIFFAQWSVFADERPVPETSYTYRDTLPEGTEFVPSDILPFYEDSSTVIFPDSIITGGRTLSADSVLGDPFIIDSITLDSLGVDSLMIDSLMADSLAVDSLAPKKGFLDAPVFGKNDSMFYMVKERKVYAYHHSEVDYQEMKLTSDYMMMDLEDKTILAYGLPNDTSEFGNRPIFVQAGREDIIMDTIRHNLDTSKSKIKGIFTKEGEGILRGGIVKRMPDETINIAGAQYTTCDADHPHFYFQLTKAKMIPNKKLIMAPTYFVMEDVPIYFIGLPFGFVPLNNQRNSGFIMPTFGEQSLKGFYLKDGGYYFAPNDYMDLTLLAGIYTLGSWETSLSSRYAKRYKYRGNVNLNYAKEMFGDRGSTDFGNMTNFRIQWSHTQDPKANPYSTFAASVNYSNSGYNKYSSNNINDYVTSQTNSSISYSRRWEGKPYSLSTNMSHSQNSRDSMVQLSFPNISFNVSRIYPFKRKERVGKERWYEKISMTYAMTFANKVTVKEDELFTQEMVDKMKNGANHTIPVSATFNIFNAINFTPSVNYTERWYFDKVHKEWNPDTNSQEITDTIRGFYRLYNYSFSGSLTTNVYGRFRFKSRNFAIRELRHVMTPSVSFAYTPDFGQDKFGYYEPIQVDSTGRMGYYSPYESGIYGVPGRNRSASMTFSLKNTLEMKVRSRSDSTGMKKIKVIDDLSFRGSYNFLADSMNLSTISVGFRTTAIPGMNVNLNMVFDPYVVDQTTGRRINKFLIKEEGKLARLSSVGMSFPYSFNGGATPAENPNAINYGAEGYIPGQDIFDETGVVGEENRIDPNIRRRAMSSVYYDFSIPYNFGFNYSINYTNNGVRKTITQTMSFNASVNLTPKWAITYNGGYDFKAKKLTPGMFNLTRDLHCWQMNFSWVPTGFMKSWSFNIAVKSGVLRDVKYDKRSSFYDNYYDK